MLPLLEYLKKSNNICLFCMLLLMEYLKKLNNIIYICSYATLFVILKKIE